MTLEHKTGSVLEPATGLRGKVCAAAAIVAATAAAPNGGTVSALSQAAALATVVPGAAAGIVYRPFHRLEYCGRRAHRRLRGGIIEKCAAAATGHHHPVCQRRTTPAYIGAPAPPPNQVAGEPAE